MSRGISIALLIAVLAALRRTDTSHLLATVDATPLLLPILLVLYFAQPIADWSIFRYLWRLPVSGFPMLLRKRIGNDLLVTYSGDIFFYLWAKRQRGLTANPFGAIKDVAVLSGLAANLLTFALMIAAYPFLGQVQWGDHGGAAVASAGLMLAASFGILIFRGRIFSLPARDLIVVFGIHAARFVFAVVLTGVLWHLAMPAASIGLWVALSALRQLVARLPLVPNTDLLFAALATVTIGGSAVAGLMALTAVTFLLLNAVFGLVLAAATLIERDAA